MADVKKVRSRTYMIVQYEKNPLTGDDLNFNEAIIKKGIKDKEKSLINWAYCCHDKDKIIEDDVKVNPELKLGDLRGKHWHVMLKFKNAIELSSVAKAFNVPENMIDKWTGAGAFEDGVYYMTHEHDNQREKGKHVYDRSEIIFQNEKIAQATWDAIDTREDRRMFKLSKTEAVERYIEKLSKGKMTLRQVFEEDNVVYVENEGTFKRARRLYLKHSQLPLVRSNFYIHGEGGAGKGVISKALARSMYPDLIDDECFFVVGDGKVAFDNYDGQPVIIWDDWRGDDLLSKFDRGTIWKIFAIHPEKVSQNVKHGEVILANAVNIVNSVDTFEKFINDLAGEYTDNNKTVHKAEDPGQGYRRFPLFINVAPESFQLYASMALTGGEMKEYKKIVNMNVITAHLAKNDILENEMTVMKPLLLATEKVRDIHGANIEEKEIIDSLMTVEVNDVSKQLGLFDESDLIEAEFQDVVTEQEEC
ncbi:TPA: hypothetical protein U1C03_002130 [Streptococcus suis]|nr:hypothetical protein [Streptococcus suis]